MRRNRDSTSRRSTRSSRRPPGIHGCSRTVCPTWLDGDYTPRSAVDIFVKDLGIIQDMARTAKFPVPVSAAALQMFLMTSAAGMGRDDDASVARMYARVTGTKLQVNKPSCNNKKRNDRMPRFAANLSMMFNEVPFLDRFDAARKRAFQRLNSSFPMSIRLTKSANGFTAMA